MYGTVNQLCARLQQRFKSDELMTLIIWTTEDVLAVAISSAAEGDGAAADGRSKMPIPATAIATPVAFSTVIFSPLYSPHADIIS